MANKTGFGISRHFIPREDYYTGPSIEDILGNLSKKPGFDYRGGAAIVAKPGDHIPLVFGTQIFQGRSIWASEIYLDDNNRPRIDIAYGISRETDFLFRIYAGNDRQLIYNADSKEGNQSGNKFWKKFNFHTGTLTQEQDQIILNHEGEDDTPAYHELTYIVFKGLKLFKFNNSAPDLYFVVGRSVLSPEEDVYNNETFTFTNGEVRDMKSNPNDGFLYATVQSPSGSRGLWEFDEDNSTWTFRGKPDNGTSIYNNALHLIGSQLYFLTTSALYTYDNPGFTSIATGSLRAGCVLSGEIWIAKSTNPGTVGRPSGGSVPTEFTLPGGGGIIDAMTDWNGLLITGTSSGRVYSWNGSLLTLLFTTTGPLPVVGLWGVTGGSLYAGVSESNQSSVFEWDGAVLTKHAVKALGGTVVTRAVRQFASKTHAGTNQAGIVYRNDGSEPWTDMAIPPPPSVAIVDINTFERHNDKLFCGTNYGLFTVGEP